jgi:uncharacterized membrane protein YagU involved in acid resistance
MGKLMGNAQRKGDMAMSETQAAERKGERHTEPVAFCLYIGFFAGLIWGLIRWLAVAMNFTKVPAAFLADPWVKRSELSHISWQFAGLGLFILMSMAAALIYYALLKRYRGPYPGLIFGALWWAVFYAGFGPVVGAVPPMNRIGWDSLITDFCLFVTWGLFIGFSIAYEYHNEFEREPARA